MATIPAMPDSSVPLLDPKTGIMSPHWYRYFQQLEAYIRGL